MAEFLSAFVAVCVVFGWIACWLYLAITAVAPSVDRDEPVNWRRLAAALLVLASGIALASTQVEPDPIRVEVTP